MGRTPDRRPGESYEEGTVYDTLSAGNDPVEAGGLRYVNGDFRMLDQFGVFNPRSASSSGDEHLLEVDPNSVGMTYVVTYGANGLATRESWSQTANARERKRIDYVYAGFVVISEVRKVYSLTDGTTVTAQKTITYTYGAGWVIAGAAMTRDV